MKTAMILAGIAALSLMAWNISTQSTSTQSVPAETRKVSVQVTDISATDSPLKISGQVFFEEQVNIDSVAVRYIIDAGLLNVSSKPIMCYEVSMALSPEYGPGTNGQYTNDHFFGDEMLVQPGSQHLLQEKPSGWEITPLKDKTKPALHAAQVQAKVVFVQYADGSRFGRSKWSEHLSADRSSAAANLNSILKSYEEGGDGPLADALQSTIKGPKAASFGTLTSLVAYHIKDTLDSKGSGAAVAELQKFVENATRRKDMM